MNDNDGLLLGIVIIKWYFEYWVKSIISGWPIDNEPGTFIGTQKIISKNSGTRQVYFRGGHSFYILIILLSTKFQR